MNDPIFAVRAVHFAATAMTVGVMAFLVLVAGPAFRAAGADLAASEYRRRAVRIAAIGLAAAVVSGAAWVMLEAAKMSGRPLRDAIAEGVLRTVLTRTTFGLASDIRLVLAVLLGVSLSYFGSRLWARWAAPLLAAGLLGALAWTGHAAATERLAGHLHVVADALHLLAAGTWLGSLVALAMLLATARRRADRTWDHIARIATLRFSTLGIVGVLILLGTGTVNTWMLAGSLPALLGTDYGRLLLIKIALFGAMLSVAAVNRLRLTPRLSQPLSGAPGNARRQLIRNSALEIGLGLIIFVIVGALGTLPPALHTQPNWPLPFRVSAEIFDHPELGPRVLTAIGMTALGMALAVSGLFWRKLRWVMILGGAAVVAYFGRGLGDMLTEAYPTSFYASPTGYTTASIARGRHLFAQHCSSCHGPTGRGDGPAAVPARVKPSDLVSGHIYAHTVGDLYWWITQGIGGAMPGFARVIDEDSVWNLIDFLYANIDGTRLGAFAGTARRIAYPAPSFSLRCPDGAALASDALRGRVIHVVVSGANGTEQIARLSERARAADVVTILVAQDAAPPPDPAFCVADDANLAQVLAIYRGRDQIEGTELLIDQAGALRALWHPGVRSPRWTDPESFRREVETMRRTPAVQRSATHLHR